MKWSNNTSVSGLMFPPFQRCAKGSSSILGLLCDLNLLYIINDVVSRCLLNFLKVQCSK